VLGVAHLRDQMAQERFGHGAGQASDRLLGEQVELLGQFRSEVRNLLERAEAGLTKALGRGILVEQVQHPGAAEVVDRQERGDASI
jgi:hypothetical protein